MAPNGYSRRDLIRDTPTKRYGIGVLYPYGLTDEVSIAESGRDSIGLLAKSQIDEQMIDMPEASEIEEVERKVERVREKVSRLKATRIKMISIVLANSYNPSSMGVSFLAEITDNTRLLVQVSGGRYHKLPVEIAGSQFTWWSRASVSMQVEFQGSSLLTSEKKKARSHKIEQVNTDKLNLLVEVYSRPFKAGKRLITVCLVNRSESDSRNEYSLFQSHFKVLCSSPSKENVILPYPRADVENIVASDEELSLSLLYRKRPTFAVGHGCAADWGLEVNEGKVSWISAECLPTYEIPSMTPDIRDEENRIIGVSMALLGGLVEGENGYSTLERVIELYEDWITEKEGEIFGLESEYRAIARKHVQGAQRCAKRMREGLEFLKTNSTAARAFQLANYSLLLQQIYSRKEARKASYDSKTQRVKFSEEFQEQNPLAQGGSRGSWRAFQIAFILMSLKSAVEGNAVDRDTVELIWFPTGGGKPSNLGLAAFALFMRRLNHNEDGVHVLMRYTLRLLTAQQFQRSSRLICAMEVLRKMNLNLLGETPFSIGLWVGGNNTPNTCTEAVTVLNGLKRGIRGVENRFILDRCPWCGAEIGPLRYEGKPPKEAPRVIGYSQLGNTVVLRCSDRKCPFSKGLPVFVIDEDIYRYRPSIIIGTVDKFAMLAWRADARALFGLNLDGQRISSPPGLIIQDELHLISGPLGSMVGPI